MWNELRTHSWGAVEIAFDHEDGDVIIETNLAAEICRAAEDIGQEAFCGQRRTASHYGGKSLCTEFFANPVLCLCDAICIENQYVAGNKVCRGQFTNLFWRYSDWWTRRIHARERARLRSKQKRGIVAAVDIAECPFVGIDFSEQQGHVAFAVRYGVDS